MAGQGNQVVTPEEVTALEVWASEANMPRGLHPELDRIKELVLKLVADWRRVISNR